MAAFSFLAGLVALVLIGVGIVLGTIAAGLTVVFVLAGILSSSTAIAVWRGKARAGLYALLVQFGIAVGVPAGMACAWLAYTVWKAVDVHWVGVLVAGAVGGAVSGVCVALLVAFVAQRAALWTSRRLNLGHGDTTAISPPREYK
jgi:hypothetical protein